METSLRQLSGLFEAGTAVGLGDAELLRRYAASRDAAAFEALVARHSPMVVATCRAVLRDPHDVEDAFQATFLVLARKASSIHAGDALGGWLHRVAYRAAVQRAKDSKRRKRLESEQATMDVPATARPVPDSDVCAILHDEVDRLPEAQRLPVVLCDLEGLTYDQAASRLRCTVPTLYHRLAQGRRRLKNRLIRRGITAAATGVALELTQASASAAVCSSWRQAAVAAATGGPIPVSVATLTRSLTRSLIVTRIQTALAALLATAIVAATGVIAVAAIRRDEPRPPAPAPAAPAAAAAEKIDQKTRPSTTLTVEARDHATNAPVPGVKLEFGLGGGQKKTQATTDAAGTARFDHAADIRYFHVTATGDGMVPQATRWDYDANAPAIPDRIVLRMEKATTVRGRVVDQDGKPVAGATVVIVPHKGYAGSRQWVNLQWEKTQTDARGHWSFTGVPEKPDSIELGVFHPMYLTGDGSYHPTDFQPLSALRDGSATLRLVRGTTVEGRVVTPDGRPVADAEIAIGTSRGYANDIPPTKSDAQGRFTLGIQPDTAARLTIHHAGFGPVIKDIRVGRETLRPTITLSAARRVTGRVVDPAGKPIAGATVSFRSLKRSWGSDFDTKTGPDGRFAWGEAPAGDVEARVYAGGYLARDHVSLATGRDHNVVLTPVTPVSGRVINASNGQPISGFSIQLGTVWSPGSQLIWQSRDNHDKDAKKTPGHFTYTIGQDWQECVIRVLADGYVHEDSPRIAPDGQPHDFTFRLTPAPPIRGTVSNPDGSPARGSIVYLVPVEQEGTIDYLDVWNGDVSKHDRSRSIYSEVDAGGRFALAPQKTGFTLVALSDSGFAIVKQPDLGRDGTIRLRPWARVSGAVILDGKPAINLPLQASDPDRGQQVFGQSRIETRYNVQTDAQGRFEMKRVLPGRLNIEHFVSNGLPDRIWGVTVAALDVEAGKTYTLKIGQSGRGVAGRLELPSSSNWMIRKAEIVSNAATKASPRSGFVQVFDDGRIRAWDVPPGAYTLKIALHEPPPADSCGWGRLLAAYSRSFTATGSADDPPIDLGTLAPLREAAVALRPGDRAPNFSVRTLTGEPVSLAGLRGKVVLLDFWATWCAPCVAELPNLVALQKTFGTDPRFAMVSLSLDEEPAPVARFARLEKLSWPQCQVGPDAPAVAAYRAEAIPATFLIGPDGTILATGLRGPALEAAIRKALGTASPAAQKSRR